MRQFRPIVIARSEATWQSHKKKQVLFIFYTRLPRCARNDNTSLQRFALMPTISM